MLFSSRINDAILTSSRVHDGQYRKGDRAPFIAHPVAVALITQKFVDDEDTFIAALLHDVLEDVSPEIYSRSDMIRDFGSDIVNIVENVTEPDITGKTAKAWFERKNGYVIHLSELSDMRSLVVSCADKIHNMSEIIRCSKLTDSTIWNAFYADRSREIWFYEAVLEVLIQKVLPEEAISDYKTLLKKIKGIK